MRGLFYGYGFSLVLQALFIAALTLFAVLGMFPNIIISSLDPLIRYHCLQRRFQSFDAYDHVYRGASWRAFGHLLPSMGVLGFFP